MSPSRVTLSFIDEIDVERKIQSSPTVAACDLIEWSTTRTVTCPPFTG